MGDASLLDFTGIPNLSPIDGMIIGGVLFNYVVSGAPSSNVVVGGGLVTNNLTPPYATTLTNGPTSGVLRLTFPSAQQRLGYGFAVESSLPLGEATTVILFDADGLEVGRLSAQGDRDPLYAGGFLGLLSTEPFVRADLRFSVFGRGGMRGFAVDNVRFAPAAQVPEPASLALLGLGVVAARAAFRRRQYPTFAAPPA